MYKKKLKILIIRFSSTGDVLLTLPLIGSIRKEHPHAHITYMTNELNSQFFIEHEMIDEVIVMSKRKNGEYGTGLWGLINKVEEGSYNYIIDLQGSLKSRLISKLGGAAGGANISRVEKESFARRWHVLTGSKYFYSDDKTVLDRYFRAANGIITPYPDKPEPFWTVEDYINLRKMLPVADSRHIIGLAPGGRWKNKLWPVNYFRTVAEYFLEKDFHVALVGGPEDTDICKVVSAGREHEITDLSGRINLRQSLALVARCVVLVTNDSATLHMAWAVNTPRVAIFGPTVREFGFVIDDSNTIVLERDEKCRPCHVHGGNKCRMNDKRCLSGIEPDIVIKAAKELLAKNGIKI